MVVSDATATACSWAARPRGRPAATARWRASSSRASRWRPRSRARSRRSPGSPVRDVRYVASQPWPFPVSLMLGFHATYAVGRAAVPRRRAAGRPLVHPRRGRRRRARRVERRLDRRRAADGLLLPPPTAIARLLIDRWVVDPGLMPRLPGRKTVPWMILLQTAMILREHWGRLDEHDRRELNRIVRKSHGNCRPPHQERARRAAADRAAAGPHHGRAQALPFHGFVPRSRR